MYSYNTFRALFRWQVKRLRLLFSRALLNGSRPSSTSLIRMILLSAALTLGSLRAAHSRPGALQWWKGNLHTHSLWSDGDDYPEMIVDWYKQHGYQFLALSDHNVLL